MRRWELEKAKTSSNAIATPERADSEAMELLQVQLGELVYVKVRKVMIRVSFATFDTIPRYTQLAAEHTKLFLME